MAGSGDLYLALREFFDVCLVALDDTPDGRPGCAYVSPGPPPWDTMPCLIVHVGGPAVADTFPLQPALAPAHRVAYGVEVNLVALTATVLRCAPVLGDEGELPTAGEFAAAAAQTSADLWAIWSHVRQAKRDGVLFGPVEREFSLEPAVALNQQGGACGWQVTVRTELGGYRPV